MVAARSQPGALLSDGARARSFHRVCELAQGGMARVDLVVRREGGFERLYAAKRLHQLHRDDDAVRAMFLDEARVAGLIRHAHVVSVLDVGEDEDGPYLLMDYVDGVSLADLLREANDRQVALPLQLCARIGAQAAHGLYASHELVTTDGKRLNLVHRDVSPQNVIVGYDGIVRVMDFGIAKALGQSTRTATGVLKGKLGYMSPEQLRYDEPDHRTDLFSLGVVIVELLSGERLYKNTSGMDGVRRILQEPPPDIGEMRSGVPPSFVELMFELLAKDREARPVTALEVARRFEDVVAELVTAEGMVNLGEFVGEMFGERRERERARVSEALRRLEDEGHSKGTASVAVARAAPAPVRSRSAWLSGGAVVVLAALAVAFVTWRRLPEASEPAAAPHADVLEVTLTIDSEPRGAEVRIAGTSRGRTPLRVELPKSDQASTVALELAGHALLEKTVVPAADQTLHLVLTPLSESAMPAPVASSPPPTRVRPGVAGAAPSASAASKSGLFRRFD